MGVNPAGAPVHSMVAVWKWGAYLGEEGIEKGIRVKISSYTRHHPNSYMTKAKTTGNYVVSQLSKMEAVRAGYDEALMLDPEGFVTQGSGENLFLVRDGVLRTPPLQGVLAGITRETVLRIAEELGIPAANIQVEEGDTDTAPYGLGTYASRSTPTAGAAAARRRRPRRDGSSARRAAAGSRR